MQKQAIFKTKGMQRDLSASAFSSEYAYENKNVRVMPTDESTLLSLINEKGNKKAEIIGIGDYIEGTPIGQSVVDDKLVVFTTSSWINDITPDYFSVNTIDAEESDTDIKDYYLDRIYRLQFNESGNLYGKLLFEGNLEFNYKFPIETISLYENSDIIKVYWTDGLNQPRVINIAEASSIMSKWNNNSFDFVRRLSLKETVTIKKDIIANGSFAPGVIQYAFTYFSKYMQESNVFYTSPLYYVSYSNRGTSPEDKVSNSFNILINNIDKNFDYIRVYSIHRTSINGTPVVKRVVNLAIPAGDYKTYINTVSGYNTKFNENEISLVLRSTGKVEKYLNEYSPVYTNDKLKTWEFDTSIYSGAYFINGNFLEFPNSTRLTINISNNNTLIQTITSKQFILYDNENNKVSYTDNGTSGDSVDPTELLYIGGEEVIFGTMAQKDNTLFLGDIKLKRKTINSTIREYFKGKNITFSTYNKSINPPKPKGYYPYSNQLNLNSYQFKTFKYLEYYRFGIQAQHYTGKWSEPIWINDVKNTVHIDTTFYSSNSIGLPVAEFTLNNDSIIKELLNNGYIRVRPVVVYPSISDREAICQGVLCPTVYNVSDRYGNSPFAQSSWFVRPNAPYDEYKTNHYHQDSEGEWTKDWRPLDSDGAPTIYSRAGVLANDRSLVKYEEDGETYNIDPVNRGAWVEFRHNAPIPSNNNRNAEIQCIVNPPLIPSVSDSMSDSDKSSWVSLYSENFYIDQSIVTLHSPDIEFDSDIRNLDTSGLKLRIVGVVPLTSCATDIDIQTSTPVNKFHNADGFPMGFYKEPIGVENSFNQSFLFYKSNSYFGWRGLVSGAFWFDELSQNKSDGNTNKLSTGFVIYPWHRNGSLNNTRYNDTNGYKSALLSTKRMSNLRYSYKTQYIDNSSIWNAYEANSDTKTGISGVSVFDSNEVSLIRIPSPVNSNLPDINYYGNVDKLITVNTIGEKQYGYPIIISGVLDAVTKAHDLFTGSYIQIPEDRSGETTGYDPIRMKYKSTPHAVIALNYTNDGAQRILPTIKDGNFVDSWNVNFRGGEVSSGEHLYWDRNKTLKSVSQDVISTGIRGEASSIMSIQYGFLWLGELYNDNVQNRFGGQTEEAFENNNWLPCGDPISLLDDDNNVKSSITIKWEEGDTYYQRYDHIKTYPFTTEDQNQVTDIVSFMCETRVNIDGRYDRNRGQTSNFAITPENFNLMNDVYSQPNNFFNYRTINPNKLNLDNFHNSITWTKTKTAGELVDTWTNITLASILDLDGDKGNVRALRRFNNNLMAFQDKGISQILYNENMQITSTEGVPIEIANSGKVNGKRYITDRVGCTNKWSICETSNGIYFIDDITKGIFLFNGQLTNISDKFGFHSWINKASKSLSIWNPVDFDSFVTYYDKVNGDVFFISKDECLAFSEPLGQFTSFYSYEKMPYFSNLGDRGIALNVEGSETFYKPWLHNEGDYNMYFGVYHPFYTTIIANPDMNKDKIFNNLEFRSDTWNSAGDLLNTTFDTLNTWNEYQEGTSNLTNIIGRPSSLKRKFRIWRANIPRSKANGRDRMRNPWLYIKLSMEKENTNKTILHDIMVHYFE